MFERYTEKARQVIFFARYEAMEAGSPSIESEQVLFSLFRADRATLSACLGRKIEESELRLRVITQTEPRSPFSTSVDPPLSAECKRILAYAAEEAERLAHTYIGAEHLLLGILREEGCLAARLLSERGISLEQTRAGIAEWASERTAVKGSGSGSVSSLGSGSWRAHRETPSTPSIRFVDEAGENLLRAASSLRLLPRIGETVAILVDGSPRRYRVLDVEWSFANATADAAQPEIILRLGRLGATA
jgi:ATP-dependent Clp protease ATP-binding subunit ClpC